MNAGAIVIRFNRETLYKELWEISASGVAKKYNISPIKLKAACLQSSIPMPDQSYWAKKHMGQDVTCLMKPLPVSDEKEVVITSRLGSSKSGILDRTKTGNPIEATKKSLSADTIHLYQFLFTSEGFLAEPKGDGAFPGETERWRFLYDSAFLACPKDADVVLRYLHLCAEAFVAELFRQPDLELLRDQLQLTPSGEQIERLLSMVPFALGAEYIDEVWVEHFWEQLNIVYAQDIQKYQGTAAFYLAEKNRTMSVPERVFFHIVESDESEHPFAFIATYGTKLESGKVKHVPLKYALTEYAHSNEQLISLLSCLNKAARVSEIIGSFIESGELFYPLRLTTEEAYQILKDVPLIEKEGIICRVPNWWKRGATSINMSLKLGEDKPSYFGLDTLLTVTPSLMIDQMSLSKEDIQKLLNETEGLTYLKGKWVVVNHERLAELLDVMTKYEGNVTLLQALRGEVDLTCAQDVDIDVGPMITNGEWLSGLLGNIRHPGKLKKSAPPKTLKATLRPYQQEGYDWLRYMEKLGFGACLADDMGLGKTVQVLAYLESLRRRDKKSKVLLVAPASLIGNWVKEAQKFTPEIKVGVLHGLGASAYDALLEKPEALPFLSITTYGMAVRIKKLAELTWDCLILDEAQAIKNPGTKQTRQLKHIKAHMRIAMTGTPIENDLTNLWSLFDFLDKGLLGSSQEFAEYTKHLKDRPEGYAKLKNMISPFMLRRVKTDKRIIADLPDKVESVDYVTLSKKQVVLYRKYIAELEERVAQAEGIERRGIVLGALTKLKQICNHPDQYMGQEAYEPKDSGKFELLRDVCETIREKHERVLIFTQFKELTGYLDDYLAQIFGRRGLVLHGSTPVAARAKLVEQFQGERYIPYMVISVKAGGTGLNLTKANHVIHFDRWWNPAVENQATDRAFRIGQTKQVMVHKLVCRGTLEERIDMMLRDKSELAENVIGSGGEAWITKLSNEELFSMLRLE